MLSGGPPGCKRSCRSIAEQRHLRPFWGGQYRREEDAQPPLRSDQEVRRPVLPERRTQLSMPGARRLSRVAGRWRERFVRGITGRRERGTPPLGRRQYRPQWRRRACHLVPIPCPIRRLRAARRRIWRDQRLSAALRKTDGETPIARRKARVKFEASVYPRSSAISTTGLSVRCSHSAARRSRTAPSRAVKLAP